MKTLSKDVLLVAPRQELIDTIISLQRQIQELDFTLAWFKRQVFGAKSERFVPDDDLQTMLELGISQNPNPQGTSQVITYTRQKTKSNKENKEHKRTTMPTHLPIVDEVIEPDGDREGLKHIGDEISWYYEMKPGSLFIKRIIRPKYARSNGEGIVIAQLPAMPVDKGNAGPGLMSQVVVDKYVYHMPLDRQRKKFKNEYDVDFAESWLCDLVKNTAFWIDSVYRKYLEEIVKAEYLQADETPIPVLVKDHRGKTHRGYFWVYHDPLRKIVIFDYRENRTGRGPAEILKDFKGILQVDGYDGYDGIILKNGIRRAGCMDHVRRRFEQALDYDNEKARYALDVVGIWYAVEREARENGLSLEDRFAIRVAKTVPSMNEFKEWLKTQLLAVLPKSPMGIAVAYALNQWPYFEPFMTDPRVELSNILVENAIRPVAIGRKNYMFKGSHDAARRGAMIYSIAAIAKLHGYDPAVYIKNLLAGLPAANTNQIDQFLLPVWKPILIEE